MRLSLRNGIIHLNEGAPLHVRGARGIQVECTDGMLWLTVEGHAQDFFLVKGQQLRIPGDGEVVVTGSPQGAIRFMVEASAPSRWQEAVVQPLRDLAWSSQTATRALLRLLKGLASYSDYLVAGRGRVLSELESNPP